MGGLSVNFLLFKEKIMFKIRYIKNPQSPKKRNVDTYGAPVFAPDCSATVLAAEMCTNLH
jgi:hypothetical protein